MAKKIMKFTTFHEFNIIYGEHTLFHYFANDENIVKAIHDKYMQLKEDDLV